MKYHPHEFKFFKSCMYNVKYNYFYIFVLAYYQRKPKACFYFVLNEKEGTNTQVVTSCAIKFEKVLTYYKLIDGEQYREGRISEI